MFGLPVVLESEEAAGVRSAAVASAAASSSERRCFGGLVYAMPGHFDPAIVWVICSPASMDMPVCLSVCLSK